MLIMLFMLLFVMLCHHGHSNLVKVEVTEAVLSSTYDSTFTANKCINNKTAGKVSLITRYIIAN